jgi:hypothetical protein
MPAELKIAIVLILASGATCPTHAQATPSPAATVKYVQNVASNIMATTATKEYVDSATNEVVSGTSVAIIAATNGVPKVTDSTVAGWGYIKSWTETDPTISAWAKATSKPTYTAAEVGARPDDWMPTAAEVGAVAVGANGGVAIGDDTYASGYASHAEGYSTFANGDYSHAEGYDTTAAGSYSHAEGYSTFTSGDYSHAEGDNTYAYGDYSHAEGVNANANEIYAFSWNGDESTTYNSHGEGTFNLNPLGGLSGLWIGGSNLATILGGYAKRTGETETVDFRNTRTMVKTQLAPVGEDAVNFDMLAGYASGIATTYASTNALVSLNQSVQYVTADSNGASVEILAPTNSMKDWVVYIYTTTNNAVLFPTGTVYAADSTVTNALKPNVVTALYLSSYPAVTNGLIVGRQEMNPIVIVR